MVTTGYCPCAKCNFPYGGQPSYLGYPLARGIIAVDPNVIPMGTRLYVEGYGSGIAADQGNAKGMGEGGILGSTRLGRTSSGRKVVMEDYEGWHTVGFQWTPLEHIFYVDGQETLRQTYHEVPVTNVPQKVWISGCLRTPQDKDTKPFYGRWRTPSCRTASWWTTSASTRTPTPRRRRR